MIGIIGTGNMGGAIIRGAVSVFGKDNIAFSGKNTEKNKKLITETGCKCFNTNSELAGIADIVVAAVKPQMYEYVINEIKPSLKKRTTFVSIAPGITTGKLKELLGTDIHVVRVMPNTPAQICEGMSAVCFPDGFEGDRENVLKLLGAIGKYTELPEKLMNASVCASGSSPAFVYMMIEAMADSAVKFGIPRDKAYMMVAQTVLGSAKMVLETGIHPAALKDAVCSPAGTTVCGVQALEDSGFRSALMKACDAVYDKCNSI